RAIVTRELNSFPTRRSSDLTIDEFWIPIQDTYQQKKLKSVTRGSADLSKIKSGEKTENKKDDNASGTENLIARLKDILKDEVREDRKSTRLNSSHVKISYAV